MLTVVKYDRYDTVNTPGTAKPAFTIWFSGCSMECKNCYNQGLWDKKTGTATDVYSVIFTVCQQCDKLEIEDIVFLGGEPMEQDFGDLSILAQKLHRYGYKIWLYTGMELEDVPPSLRQYMYTIKCGIYDESLKCDGIPSSTNQKFYRKDANGEWSEIILREEILAHEHQDVTSQGI